MEPNTDDWDEELVHTKFVNIYGVAEWLLMGAAHMDITSAHTVKTAHRFVRMLKEMTTPVPFNFTTFNTDRHDLIVIKNCPVVSLCAHHVIPFRGWCHVGYIPQGQLAGLSKVPRLIEQLGKGLTVQEELTGRIADGLEEKLGTKDIAVAMECEHLCMTIRGVQAPGTTTYTAVMRGAFEDHAKTAKMEFLQQIGHK